MTQKMAQVTAVPTTLKDRDAQGKETAYGPFYASADKPFLEVPERFAVALRLPRYVEGETPAPKQPPKPQQPAPQPQQPAEDKRTVAQLTEALKAKNVDIPDGAKRDDLVKLAADTGA